ncbi:endonuclease/exonuclease/phosphatase family protein [Acrocarpospora corrugata]|uniref:endonuclease/exonuclease/phosphatase family protein n=1 Tax=Acrocarpospora corrugata TaxID=35763 RepID=UPI0014795F76|nr:endonuclease/exonuclease/phosphatase family protein [Acrocarpospora corrugata]
MVLDVADVTAPSLAEPRRRWVSVLVWLGVAPFGLWAVLRIWPHDLDFLWVQLVAFTPAVVVVSLVAPLVALVTRRWIALVVAVAVSGMLAAEVLPRAIPGTNTAVSGQPLRVLASNSEVGSVPPEALVGLVAELRPDALALQELTPQAVEGLRTAGLGQALPFYAGEAREGAGGSGIYARFPVKMTNNLDYGGFGQVKATVDRPGGAFDVVSVHPCAPVEKSRHWCWATGLDTLPAPDNTILLGDFNATLDHAGMRQLLNLGYRDAADTTGDGLATTWPVTWDFRGLPIPAVTLDHILVDQRTAVHGFSTHVLPETDHRAVFAVVTTF